MFTSLDYYRRYIHFSSPLLVLSCSNATSPIEILTSKYIISHSSNQYCHLSTNTIFKVLYFLVKHYTHVKPLFLTLSTTSLISLISIVLSILNPFLIDNHLTLSQHVQWLTYLFHFSVNNTLHLTSFWLPKSHVNISNIHFHLTILSFWFRQQPYLNFFLSNSVNPIIQILSYNLIISSSSISRFASLLRLISTSSSIKSKSTFWLSQISSRIRFATSLYSTPHF
jgi:hypothetical protein